MRRSEQQAVETTTGLLLGTLVTVLLVAAVWAVAEVLGLSGTAWSRVWFWGWVVAVAAGAAVLVWWLVRARRHGL